EMEFGELARLYADPALETPTDSLPLDGPDRKALRSWYTHYSHLSEHPLLPYQEPPTNLENAFENLGSGKKPSPQMAAEIGHADVMEGLRRARDGLRYLAVKHFALRRVRELCRTGQTATNERRHRCYSGRTCPLTDSRRRRDATRS